MVKATAKLLLAGAAFAAAMYAGTPKSYAFGDAPWCAVIGLGPGDAYWDCEYATIEACRPNILAGNRGFCNPNPWPGPSNPPSAHHRSHH